MNLSAPKYDVAHKLNRIPIAQIEKCLEESRLSFQEQREFNTNHHSLEEISAVLPDIHHDAQQAWSWVLLEPFLPFIAASQGYHSNQIHQIRLPKPLIAHLPSIIQSSSILGRLSESDKEDLEAMFPRQTTRGEDIDSLTRETQFFIRLDACSLKDALQGSGPAKSTADLWTRLATSSRGMRGIMDLQALHADSSAHMWLLPWQDLEPSLEYRVFCPPPLGPRGTRISAISQYRWHNEWRHAAQGEYIGAITERLVQGCHYLLEQILQCEGMTEGLRLRGFVFDVAEERGEGPVRLVELNDFGAMTGCGSCLFHWVRDAEVLYGLKDELEVRVAMG